MAYAAIPIPAASAIQQKRALEPAEEEQGPSKAKKTRAAKPKAESSG